MRWKIYGTLGLVAFLLAGAAIGCAQPLVLVFYTAFGWLAYLIRVVPDIQVPPGSIAVAVGCLALILLLGHTTGRWLWNAIKPDAAPAWRWKFTLCGVVGLVLLFACGMAATGAAHQIGWLMQDPGPMWEVQYREASKRIHCQSNLRQIGRALAQYAIDHDNQLPPTLDDLPDLVEDDLVCPSRPFRPYIYYGAGHPWPLPDAVPLAAEPLANHKNEGMLLLFGDGTVRWEPTDTALTTLARRPTSRPRQP